MFWLPTLISATSVGIELRRNSRIYETTNGLRGQLYKNNYIGFEYSKEAVQPAKALGKNTIYNFVDETVCPTGHKYHFFVEGENEKESAKISGLESPVDFTALSSLYFSKLLEKTAADTNIVVSAPDHNSNAENKKINQIFRNLHLKSSVVPESLCALAHTISLQNITDTKNFLVLNYLGKETVASLYKVFMEHGKKMIELVQSSTIDVSSDKTIEHAIFKALSDQLRAAATVEISFIPYEQITTQWYCDISNVVRRIVIDLQRGTSSFNVPELRYYSVDENDGPKSFLDVNFNIKAFKESMVHRSISVANGEGNMEVVQDDSSITIKNIPENTNVLYMSDLGAYRENGFTSKFRPVDFEAVYKGAEALNNVFKFRYKDARVNNDYMSNSKLWQVVKREIETKAKAKKLFSKRSELLSTHEFLEEGDLKAINEVADAPSTLEECKNYIKQHEALENLNSTKEVKFAARQRNFRNLKETIKLCKGLKPELKSQLGDIYEIAKKWYMDNKKEKNNDRECEKMQLKLKTRYNIIMKAQKKLEEEEKARLEAEKAKEENANGAEIQENANGTELQENANGAELQENAGESIAENIVDGAAKNEEPAKDNNENASDAEIVNDKVIENEKAPESNGNKVDEKSETTKDAFSEQMLNEKLQELFKKENLDPNEMAEMFKGIAKTSKMSEAKSTKTGL
ncbi:hypothetical protein ENBRE01_1141 [Enteropsectra breve]|nr:hypothetical protein ENBRE01_1141 [Enteropsectra breve]